MKKPTQKDKILKALRGANGGKISARYFKQQLLISEVNGRISELRTAGYDISTEGTDEFGFAYHRLVSEPKPKFEIVYDEARNVRVIVPVAPPTQPPLAEPWHQSI